MGIFRSRQFGSGPLRGSNRIEQRCVTFIQRAKGPNSEKFVVFGPAEWGRYLYTVCRVPSFEAALAIGMDEHARLGYPPLVRWYVIGEDRTTTPVRVVSRQFEYEAAKASWTMVEETLAEKGSFATIVPPLRRPRPNILYELQTTVQLRVARKFRPIFARDGRIVGFSSGRGKNYKQYKPCIVWEETSTTGDARDISDQNETDNIGILTCHCGHELIATESDPQAPESRSTK